MGDSSYEFFCQTAKDFDERLAKLGAALVARVDCDVDFETDADVWSNQVTTKLQEDFKSAAVVPMPGLQLAAGNNTQQAAQEYTKKNPFPAELVESIKITGRDSVKDIRHIETLEDSGIQYEPGDALGVWFKCSFGC